MNYEKIEEALHYLRQMDELTKRTRSLLNELITDHDAQDDVAVHKRTLFRVIEGGKEEKEKNRQSKPLKFTKKEIDTMPVQYKNLFFSENAVAHIRLRKDNFYEIRCQLGKKRITATSKSLETAKKKFIYNLHQYAGVTVETEKVPCITFAEYALKWL